MAITLPPHYSSTDAVGTASTTGRIVKLPYQARVEREAARKARSQLPVARPYTPFFVPSDVLETGYGHQDQSAFLQLPIEILLLIVQKVEIPYFQVVLGLTCKTLAAILSDHREKLTPWRGFRDKEGLYRLLTRRPLLSPPANSLLQPSQLTDTSAQPYIPDSLRLCRACFRHVPRCETYWLPRMSSEERRRPHVNYFDILNFFGESGRKCGQHKCPECCVRNNTCFMSGAEYEKALAEDYRDEEVYLIDLGEEGRRVCDELPRRIGRP